MSKALEFYEVAAKKGSLEAHKELSKFHKRSGNVAEVIKHSKVVASAGDKEAMDSLMSAYGYKLLSKEDLAQTLRAHQASNDLMKSKDRDHARVVSNHQRQLNE